MKPWQTVETAKAPDGAALTLSKRDDEWLVRVDNRVLMGSRMHGSEERLASVALERLATTESVLVGGLGLGFTLKEVLKRAQWNSRVVVSELVPAIVEWNRTHVGHLTENAIADTRVTVETTDVLTLIQNANQAFDAVILDVDNGPVPVAHQTNGKLYLLKGVRSCFRAIRPGGRLTVWSAGPDLEYLERLKTAGFDARMLNVPANIKHGPRHTIFLAEVPRR